MSFFFVDDQLQANRKVHDLIEADGVAGAAALGMWTIAGSLSKAPGKGSNGVMTDGDLVRIMLDKRLAMKLAKLLVRVELWHTAGHDCPKCPPVAPGSYLFHDWYQFKYAEAGKERVARDRKAELKDNNLREAIWARDGDGTGTSGWCRYCGHVVRRKDTVSVYAPAFDHVIPGVARGVDNVVLACAKCNGKKGQRTPEQAGMPVRPAPDLAADHHQDHGTDHGPDHGATVVKGGPPHGDGDGGGDGPALGTAEGWLGAPAGDAPDVATPDRGGSPWLGYTGPYIEPPPESMCHVHEAHLPCRECAAEIYDREADQ